MPGHPGSGAATGARVRAVREERGLSLSALAAAAGGLALGGALAAAGPLGVPLVALVADGVDEVGDQALTSVRLHVEADEERTTEVYLIRVRPGAERPSPAHAPGVVEQVVVLSGTGEIDVDGEAVALVAGTHHAWPADRPHTYRCTSDVELVAVDVIVTPRPGIS